MPDSCVIRLVALQLPGTVLLVILVALILRFEPLRADTSRRAQGPAGCDRA